MKKNNKIKLRIIFLIFLICTFGIIFIFSNQNGTESSKVSQGFIYNILKFFINDANKVEYATILVEPIVRKIAHFSLYTLVGVWSISLLETYNLKEQNKIVKIAD